MFRGTLSEVDFDTDFGEYFPSLMSPILLTQLLGQMLSSFPTHPAALTLLPTLLFTRVSWEHTIALLPQLSPLSSHSWLRTPVTLL